MPLSTPLVLVVDDDPELRDLLADVLTLEDYRVITAANGLEARLLLDLCLPALVLLDLQMPLMDGRALVQCLRAEGCAVPIVLMSGAVHGQSAARELGVHGFLAKPFDLETLLATVARISGARRLHAVA
jgi:two-component system, NtrC family, nitrogen regulation response regulator NtrX